MMHSEPVLLGEIGIGQRRPQSLRRQGHIDELRLAHHASPASNAFFMSLSPCRRERSNFPIRRSPISWDGGRAKPLTAAALFFCPERMPVACLQLRTGFMQGAKSYRRG